MTTLPNVPDYDTIADRFDRFLPLIAPVGEAVLARLSLPQGGTVLDVACGTGEPGLTLARRRRDVRVLGVDSAKAMIAVAEAKAAREGLDHARFEVMTSEALTLADGSLDALISRFGLLMFGDVPASARELARVLRPGGAFSLAVWEAPEKNTLVGTTMRVIEPHLPPGQGSPLDRLRASSSEQARVELLRDVGVREVHSEELAWTYDLRDFDEIWDLVSSLGGFTGQATLSADAEAVVRVDLEAALSTFRQPSGRYAIPHGCRLLSGRR